MNLEEKRNLLSNEFKTAVSIYEITEVRKEKVWSHKLQKVLADYMSASTVPRMLRFLESWHIIKAQYGETEENRPGKLFYVSNEDREAIKTLYERYWKE
jgi:hypothetical protein